MKKVLLLVAGCLLSAATIAHELKAGQSLPPVLVEAKGQMEFEYLVADNRMVFQDGSDIRYRPWSTSELTGRIRCIYHLAARHGVADINQPFIDALIAARLPEHLPDSPFKTTTILDTDDALWGTAGLAASELEDSQRKTPHAYYVNDTQGLVRTAWGLQEKTSTVIILDEQGKILYVREGEMTQAEIDTTVAMIVQELAK